MSQFLFIVQVDHNWYFPIFQWFNGMNVVMTEHFKKKKIGV